MNPSGLTDVSEYLQVIPKEHVIIRQIRHKYRCSKCHGDIKTAPGMPRIKAGSSYSDDMIIDIAMSKYCDLLPIERYRAMAERLGFPGLPANSLIESTHYLADFVKDAVQNVKTEVLSSRVLMADETPHRMLEGSEKSSWYLWGFSNDRACYFECKDTRSGDVAFDLLKEGKCEVLVSDVYSGYGKAVRITNEQKALKGEKPMVNAYCNAHARRKFKECEQDFGDVIDLFLDDYKKIYSIEARCKRAGLSEISQIRQDMLPIFDQIKLRAESQIDRYSSKSSLSKACRYFLTNFEGLTLFISNPDVPIDNNAQERALRSPVIGRKTWLGTHSQKGAETAAKLFTLVESCKLNKVNPRAYFKFLVNELHMKREALTPWQFKEREKT
jgi:transposase